MICKWANNVVFAVLLVLLGCRAPASDEATPNLTVAPASQEAGPASWKEIKRIFIIILENTDAQDAMKLPYLSSLGKKGARFSHFSGLTHPSQPNYIGLIAGDTAGVSGDGKVDLDGLHIGDLLKKAGKKWKVYSEDYPGNCYQEMVSGLYARRHVPFLSFKSVTGSSECQKIVSATNLSYDVQTGGLAEFSLYIPNNNNNGHDTSPDYADRWLSKRFDTYLNSAQFMEGTLVIITYDEGSRSLSNQIATVFYGAGVKEGAVSEAAYNHYSTLATVEKILNLGDLGKKDKSASVIEGIWK